MSQVDKLYNLLSDGEPHSTVEILQKVYGGDHLGLARVGARIYDIKKKYHVMIAGKPDTITPTIYWYKIMETPKDIQDKYSSLFEETRQRYENHSLENKTLV